MSRASGAGGAGGDDDSQRPDISADGRYVVFESDADNLSADDDDAFTNIFVRDLAANTATLVSRAPGVGGAGANGNSFFPTISGSGNRVVFQSGANNLSAEDNNAVQNIFARDLAPETNALVSRATGVAGPGGNGNSTEPDMSPSGRYVTFASEANTCRSTTTTASGTSSCATSTRPAPSWRAGPTAPPARAGTPTPSWRSSRTTPGWRSAPTRTTSPPWTSTRSKASSFATPSARRRHS